VQSDELLCATAIATGRMLQIRNLGENSAEDRGLRSARETEPFCDKTIRKNRALLSFKNLQVLPQNDFYAGLSGKTGAKKWRRLRESNPCRILCKLLKMK
jgi:hypothetical protein